MKNLKNKVSIIIPSYNHQKFIVNAINSVINQTYQNWEVIIVDDGSTDATKNVLSVINDKRIKIHFQSNCGAHEAINRGIKLATGDYISILNSDDEYQPSRLEECVYFLQNNPTIGLVSTWIEIIDQAGKKIGIKKGWGNYLPWDIPDIQNSYLREKNFAKNLFCTNFVSTTSNIFMNRDVFNKVGKFRNLRYAHDWDFLLRSADKVNCQLLEKPLVKYRLHSSNTISTNRRRMLFEILWVLSVASIGYEGKFIFNNPESLSEDFVKTYSSINLQFNDKVFWVLKSMILGLRKKGISETSILNDEKIIRSISNFIVD